MKKTILSKLVTGLLSVAALVAVASSPANAAFVVGGEQGWQMSFDGMINVFAVYDAKDQLQFSNGVVKQTSLPDDLQSFRVRTGLLPSIFAFNVKSPTINGVDYGARIGLYPEIQNNGTRTGLGPGSPINNGTSIDIREVFLTADGCFGQFLAGRALNLFEGKNILTDMTLIGNGVPLNLTGGGVDLGHIGYGYTYTSFGPQFRYTTPDYKGAKLAFAIADPSRIGTNVDVTGANGLTGATGINQPRFEMELSYATNLPGGKMNAWLAGLYQEAKFNSDKHKVASIGGAGGVQAFFGPFEALISGFGGQALGMTLTQDDGAALDAARKERVSFGGLAHATYTIGKAKIGAQYGINYADRTDNDIATPGFDGIKSKQAVTGGIYYSVNKYMTLVGEYTWARDAFYDNSRQTQNIGSLGTVFVW